MLPGSEDVIQPKKVSRPSLVRKQMSAYYWSLKSSSEPLEMWLRKTHERNPDASLCMWCCVVVNMEALRCSAKVKGQTCAAAVRAKPHNTHRHTQIHTDDFMALESAIHLNKRWRTEEAHCEPPMTRITLPRPSQLVQHISVRPT